MANPRHVHFVGIGGIHMSGLARILLEDGVRVTGSDLVASAMTEGLIALGAEIHVGHDASHVAGAELVVRTVAVGDDNPEIVAARSGGIELISRAEMVERIAQGHRALTVAGSHGKTTTSTMLAFILREAGQEPSFILGGESPDLGTHATRGRGDLIVLEADEYGRAFHEYEPSVAVITNLERDHLDFYGSDEALQEAFVVYAATLVANGTLLVEGNRPAPRGSPSAWPAIGTMSPSRHSAWRRRDRGPGARMTSNVRQTSSSSEFCTTTRRREPSLWVCPATTTSATLSPPPRWR